MDSLTHILLGATTAQLGFRQALGRPATWIAGLAAVLPDADILIDSAITHMGYKVGDVAPILGHRILTHSLVMAVPVAMLIAWIWWSVSRRRWLRASVASAPPPAVADSAAHPLAVAAKSDAARQQAAGILRDRPRYLPRLACVLLAAVTHPILDACTSYGIELFSPISRARFAFHALPIVDFIFSPLIVLTLLACWLVRRRSLARAAARETARSGASASAKAAAADSSAVRPGAPRLTAAIAAIGLLLACGYATLGRLCHDRVIELARQAAVPAAPSFSSAAAPAAASITAPHSAAPPAVASPAAAPPLAIPPVEAQPAVTSADAYAAVGSIFLWRAVVQTDQPASHWLVARVRPWYTVAQVRASWARAPQVDDAWVRKAKEDRYVQNYYNGADGVVRTARRVDKNGDQLVEFHDMRYAPTIGSVDSRYPILMRYDSRGRLKSRENLEKPHALLLMVQDAWSDLWRP